MTPWGVDPQNTLHMILVEQELALQEASHRRLAREVRRGQADTSHCTWIFRMFHGLKRHLHLDTRHPTVRERSMNPCVDS